MIQSSTDFNLGQDETRIKDPNDAKRQHETVRVLLDRFFNPDPEKRWEVQVVADEVGMGKTFVALATAYSILAQMSERRADGDLPGCQQKVLIIAPQNSALYDKWQREVHEFVRRCVLDGHREGAALWFKPTAVDRLDDLARELRGRGNESRILVTHTGVLGQGKFKDYDAKRRFLLGALFRYWGNGMRNDARERLLRGAPESWPKDPSELRWPDANEHGGLPFASEREALDAIELVDDRKNENEVSKIEALRLKCKEIAEPYARDRASRFDEIEKALIDIYRDMLFAGIEKALPLVIVDEAHNWKNGPSRNTNGYKRFSDFIAPLTRRALLLTATPFQLRPDEMLEILKVGDVIAPCPSQNESEERQKRLATHRETVIRKVLDNSAEQSRLFARTWARLPKKAAALVEATWVSPALVDAREKLRRVAHLPGVVEETPMSRIIDSAVTGLDADIRALVREGLKLYAFNLDLSQELGTFVIRHRRKTDHRLVRVGSEFQLDAKHAMNRSDKHVLHDAAGIDVRGPGELPHYLLMRCVSEMKGRGRSSLGNALTGCYSTLLESAEGKKLQNAFGKNPSSKAYFDVLLKMVDEKQDPEHPKVCATVDAVVKRWQVGEKTLIFCFRAHTAKRLHEIIEKRIKKELEERRKHALGGEGAFANFRKRFGQRDAELMNLGLDRVLWSLLWAARNDDVYLYRISPTDLIVEDADFERLARLSLRFGVNLEDERVDRVFLHRAVEHILACRVAEKHSTLRRILEKPTNESWVGFPYGEENQDEIAQEAKGDDEKADFDQRGVQIVYKIKNDNPDAAEIRKLAGNLIERRQRARQHGHVSIFDAYAEGASFWLGTNPKEIAEATSENRIAKAVKSMHRHLFALTREGQAVDWRSRLFVFQAMRRAALSPSALLRMLPDRSEQGETDWADVVVKAFFETLGGQNESMADRLGVFVEDLRAVAGPIYHPGTGRHSLFEASKLKGQEPVALVNGSTPAETRRRMFDGFNSPLVPEVLICTMVGQEGIDLHRHCRHVIHYDLAWNPAVLEQRTGRVDRIGSKTFRERAMDSGDDAFLDVGVPFLAGTYDERMYEELRIRAQTFEVLTGGDVSADNVEGHDQEEGAEGEESGIDYVPLPASMMADLRVTLHVWTPG